MQIRSNPPANVATGAGQSAARADQDNADPFGLDNFVSTGSVRFDKPISLADLARCMSDGKDGAIVFDFSNVKGAHVEK